MAYLWFVHELVLPYSFLLPRKAATPYFYLLCLLTLLAFGFVWFSAKQIGVERCRTVNTIFAGLGHISSTKDGDRRILCEGPLSLRVFGCLPDTDAWGRTEAGVRKASREETAGEFAPTLMSVYGEFVAAA